MIKKDKKDATSKTYRGPWAELWHRLKKNRLSMLSLFILAGFMVISIISFIAVETSIGQKIFEGTVFDYQNVVGQNLKRTLEMPSSDHLLGTDSFGRDTLARLVYGARISITIGLSSVFTSVLIGGSIGALVGYVGGRVDNIIMRMMDVFLAIPSILLAIAIVSSLGSALPFLILAIAIPSIPGFARITRAAVMTIREQEFIEAANAIGASNIRIVLKHIIPNSMAPLIIQSTLSIAGAILSTAGLSFIGLGVKPPMSEWGNMLSEGKNFITTDPFFSLITGLTIVVVILSLNILGDGLRDALDPKLKN